MDTATANFFILIVCPMVAVLAYLLGHVGGRSAEYMDWICGDKSADEYLCACRNGRLK